jgi:hypothetical protein
MTDFPIRKLYRVIHFVVKLMFRTRTFNTAAFKQRTIPTQIKAMNGLVFLLRSVFNSDYLTTGF